MAAQAAESPESDRAFGSDRAFRSDRAFESDRAFGCGRVTGLAEALVAAARRGDSAALGLAYQAVLEDDATDAACSHIVAQLRADIATGLDEDPLAEQVILAVHGYVRACWPGLSALIDINVVEVEHFCRSLFGVSDHLARLDDTQALLLGAVLLGSDAAPDGGPAAPDSGAGTPTLAPQPSGLDGPAQQAVDALVHGDVLGWQELSEQVWSAGGLSAALAEVADRLTRNGISPGAIVEMASAASVLAAASADGPLQCPAVLLEATLRAAAGHQGCLDNMDERGVVFAATQACALIDLHDALLPPGWGWAVHGSLAED